MTERQRRTPRIAVVDDDTAYIELLCELLGDEGMQVACYLNSADAFRELVTQHPDLIILDVRLERPDAGWQLLEMLRLHPATAAIPIILCSADAAFLRAKADLLHAQRVTALEKPFDLGTLLEQIQRALDLPPHAAPS